MAAAAVVLFCSLVVPGSALAIELTVDSSGDEVDATLGNESCLTAGGKCTLRAAIEEGESLGEFTRIEFQEDVFEGQAAAAITLGSSLPPITVPAFVNGRTCETEAGLSGPCVGIEGSSGEPALVVSNAEEAEILGLSITGAQTGIVLEGSPRTKVQASWLGIALDGTLAGNGSGVLVGPGSNRSLIGGEGIGLGNVFAGQSDDGLDVHGGNGVRIFGNYFGVGPGGIAPGANGGDDIEVVSTEGLELTGTTIGTRVSSTAASTSSCDGGCNLISGAGSDGIDLQGDGGSEVPAASTSISGNYIGLDAAGVGAVSNVGAGVRVGEAAHTAIGGPAEGDTNRVAGGAVGILAGPAAPDLSIRGNSIGTDASGLGTLAPPDDGIVVDSAELPSPVAEAEITGNEIHMEEGTAIAQRGQGAWVAGNRIAGSQVGIATAESTAGYGNVIEANLIDGPSTVGILIENDLNEIAGNEIAGAGGAGIRIKGSLPFGVSGNRVGGDVSMDENVIEDSAGAAVEISDLEATTNEVARNRGAGNGGFFVDLIATSPGAEPNGPNEGIDPPPFSSSSQTGAGGNGVVSGATVRVFRKQTAAPGELASFLGEAIVDAAGGWMVVYDSAIPAGTPVAATQTSGAGGTSELSLATTTDNGIVIENGGCAFAGASGCAGNSEGGNGSGSSSGGGSGQSFGRFWPRTTILSGPKRRSRKRVARFEFESDKPGSRFLCRLDERPFDLCGSPRRYRRLQPGRHVFEVRAVDPAGHLDPTPAKAKFAVVG